jgi:hypothetical protein
VVFAGVICDPFNMLFANSLYTEFSALLGAYMVIGSALVALLLRQFNRSLLLLWFTGLALLGGSRVQHLLLPLVLLVPVWWVMLRGKKGIWVASLVIAVMTVVLQFGLQHQYGKIDDANRINSLFYTILPTHPEPAQLAENLGIEPACAQLTNTSWYLRRGRDHRAECPGAFTLSRARLVAVLASDPITATRLFFRALHQSGAWRLPYVGEVSGVEFEKAGGFSGGSIAGLIAIMPFSVYALFYILPLWAGLWSGAWLLSRRDSEHTMFRTLVLAQALLALVILIVAMTALFGDGFSEFSRHVHLAHNACAVSWIIMPLLLFSALRQGRETRSAGPGKGLLGMIAGAVLLIILVPIGVPAMALGFGVMDEPAGETWSTAPIQLSGWAMDPNGVASVEAVVDGGRSWPLQWQNSSRWDNPPFAFTAH